MGNLLKRCFMGAVAVLLAVSILFCNVTERYYAVGAAVPSAFSLIETLFISLGFTFSLGNTADTSSIEGDFSGMVQEWQDTLSSDKAKERAQDLSDFFTNIIDYWTGVALEVPEAIFETLREFVGSQMVTKQLYKPTNSSINLYGCSLVQYRECLASLYGLSADDSYLKKFCNATYDYFVSDGYSCLIGNRNNGSRHIYYRIGSSGEYGYRVINSSGSVNLYVNDSRLSWSAQFGFSDGVGNYFSDFTYGVGIFSSYGESNVFFVNGQLYDIYSVASCPTSTAVDSAGSTFKISDFAIPSVAVSTGVNVSTVSDVADVYEKDAYDVITPGREWDKDKSEAVGDVVLPVPSDTTLEQYRNGELTWEEMLELIDAIAVDTAEGVNILSGEFMDTQTGILSGVNGILDGLADIVGFLDGLIERLVSAFLDMLLSLVVPRDGFIEGKIRDLQYKLNSLGIAPYDMSVIFDDGGGGNPFKDITIWVSGKEVVIVSFAFLPKFLNEFRPVFRGLLVLFLLYYSINQLLSLLRLSGIMEGGNSNPIQVGIGMGSNAPQIADKGGK